MNENEIAYKVIGIAIQIHKDLGPGIFESVYEKVLQYELIQAGLETRSQVPLPLIYKGIEFEAGFRVDLLIENKVIIEIKSIENIAPIHFSQLLTYLRLSNIKLGLLINFNTKILKEGIHRVVNNL